MNLLFLLPLLFIFTPWASPPLALLAGIAMALVFGSPYPAQVKSVTKTLLQASVVGLGFGLNLHQVLKAGLDGLAYTAVGILFTMAVGTWLGRLLRVPETTSYLISTGTAICGGSAIAAVGPILEADHEEMSVALGTVFLLNAAALFAFPAIGAALGLTQEQFGLWAAMAIHDTSSVVGATVKYGVGALAVGTTVKLVRALWIVPLCLVTAARRASSAKVQWPWFILFFVLAAAANTLLPQGRSIYSPLNAAAKAGLIATLFLVGSGISKEALRKVGPRPLLQGVLLWLLVAGVSLAFVAARP
ncbi:MAG: putative sulfate exporter family transporter [Elusimicrobia bacterium]|nr:putative sulfate exporter family transporter [Elusimicrobiota bacterium]